MSREEKQIFSGGRHLVLACAVAMGFLLGPSSLLYGEEANGHPAVPPAPDPQQYSAKVQELVQFLSGATDSFEYKRVGRPDPFMPFVSEAVIQAETEIPEAELIGMQKFEPGQLTLVAIVFTEDEPLAMVQDSVGKGYVIRNGTEIGRNGRVDRISDNVVVIKQRYLTTAGEERYTSVEMLLKKEGEQ